MKNIDFAKLLFFFSCLLFSFTYGIIVITHKIFPHAILDYVRASVIQVYKERRTLAATKPEHFLQPARYNGDGVTVNEVPEDRKELIFLSGFFEDTNELRLIRRDGAIVVRWPVRFSEIFPDTSHLQHPPATELGQSSPPGRGLAYWSSTAP